MTAHPIDTEALRKQYAHLVEKYGFEAWAESRAHVVLSLLDALAAAEHRIARLEAQTDIRGRAVVMYRERAREAEARIKAVQDLIDQADTAGDWAVTCSRLQWAIDGTSPIEHQETR